jgi:hypothetical protein
MVVSPRLIVRRSGSWLYWVAFKVSKEVDFVVGDLVRAARTIRDGKD